MKHFTIAIALIGTLTSAAGAAAPSPDTSATFVCRAATPGESANAQLTGPATGLVCKPFSVAVKMSDGSTHTIGHAMNVSSPSLGPDITRAVTPAQVNDSWVRYMDTAFNIQRSN